MATSTETVSSRLVTKYYIETSYYRIMLKISCQTLVTETFCMALVVLYSL